MLDLTVAMVGICGDWEIIPVQASIQPAFGMPRPKSFGQVRSLVILPTKSGTTPV